jgi:subtilase family serine protease
MNTFRITAAALIASVAFPLCAAAPVAAAPSMTYQAMREQELRDLAGNVVHVRDARDLGREAADTPIRVSLLMRAQHEAELRALVAAQSTRGSIYFKKYLSSAQFRNYFAPDAATYARTITLLQKRGFHVMQTFPNRGMIRATMPSALAERYFHTEIHRVSQDGAIRYMNVKPITVPAEIKAVAASVVGLHSVHVVHFDHIFRAAQRGSVAGQLARLPASVTARIRAAQATRLASTEHPQFIGATPNPYKSPAPMTTTSPKPNPAPDPAITPDNGMNDYLNYQALGPGVFAGGYDFPVVHGYGGSGQGVASVLDGDYLNSDAMSEFTTFGIPRDKNHLGTRVYTTGTPYTTTDSAGAGETTLDAETIMSLAPSANYYLYLEPNFDDEGITANYEKVISDNIVGAVSSSFGACETDDPAFGYQTDYLAMEGSSLGITFSASTGDTGGGGCGVYVTNGAPQTIKGVAIPAAGYYFTAVGGTDYLYVAIVDSTGTGGTYPTAGENGWTFGGGGVSVVNPLPAWQAATTNIGTTGRNMPDISFVADPDPPGSGEVIFDGGSAAGSGGTSLSSPVFAALMAEINQVEGTRNGWVNPRLYDIQNKQGYYAFHDVMTGDNVFNAAGVGYDNVTGIGTINGFLLAGEL